MHLQAMAVILVQGTAAKLQRIADQMTTNSGVISGRLQDKGAGVVYFCTAREGKMTPTPLIWCRVMPGVTPPEARRHDPSRKRISGLAKRQQTRVYSQ